MDQATLAALAEPDLPAYDAAPTGAPAFDQLVPIEQLGPPANMTPADDPPEDDDLTAAASSALQTMPTHIESQAQWNALPAWQKDLLRIQMSGVKISDAQAMKYATTAIQKERNAYQPKLVEVEDPSTPGKKMTVLMTSANSAQPVPRTPATKLETSTAPDGTVMMIDPTSGKSFPAWDSQTGQPIKARTPGTGAKLSATDQVTADMTRSEVAKLRESVNALAARVKSGDRKLAGFGGGYDGDLAAERARLRAKLQSYQEIYTNAGLEAPQLDVGDQPSGGGDAPAAAPNVTPTPSETPSPTPAPQPQPTPRENTPRTLTAQEASQRAGRKVPPGRYRDKSGNVLVVTQ